MTDQQRRRTQPAGVRREQLLEAARSVLVERGLRAATVGELAKAAGMAKGTVYLYFASKDELLAALRERCVQDYVQAVDAGPGPAPERLRRLVLGLFEASARNQQLHRVLFHEAGFSEADALAALRAKVRAVLVEGMARGELVELDAEVAASFVVHGVHGALGDASARGPRRRKRAAEAVAELVLRALQPATPRSQHSGL